MSDEILYAMAMTRLSGFNFQTALELYRSLGSCTSIYEHRHDIGDIIPDATPRLIAALDNWSDALTRSNAEMEFISRHGIHALTLNDPNYPQRMKECDDAPIIMYYKGTADLNQQHVINIVGTRRCTTYGQDIIRRFIADLRQMCPKVLVISGLAYGIDICAHRESLAAGYDTLGVLAHGLDQLYPPRHRDTAAEMVKHGGLITEFMSQTNADKVNFVRRNRIVAGMSDATVLVESAAKGGGLITCDIARSYNRDVFAFPGSVTSFTSEGCNNLIRDNGAALISNASDFVKAMGWQNDAELKKAQHEGIERQLFPDLNADEQTVVNILIKNNDIQLNILSVQSNIPIGKLTAILFQLEMKGIVKPLAGGTYHLII